MALAGGAGQEEGGGQGGSRAAGASGQPGLAQLGLGRLRGLLRQKEGHEEEEDDGDMRGELNEEEREALQGLVSEQADALKDGACQTCC